MDENDQTTEKDWLHTLLTYVFVGIGGALGVEVTDILSVGPLVQIVVYTVIIAVTVWVGVDLLPRLA
jgi:hypothetical protein